jgi:hypothetical protein
MTRDELLEQISETTRAYFESRINTAFWNAQADEITTNVADPPPLNDVVDLVKQPDGVWR